MYPTELAGDGQNYLKGHCCFSLTARYIGHANDISVLKGALCRSRLQERDNSARCDFAVVTVSGLE